MTITIKDVDMPTTCQECPCFNNLEVTANIKEIDYIGLTQLCNASHKVLKGFAAIDAIPKDWTETEKPNWCPIVESSK